MTHADPAGRVADPTASGPTGPGTTDAGLTGAGWSVTDLDTPDPRRPDRTGRPIVAVAISAFGVVALVLLCFAAASLLGLRHGNQGSAGTVPTRSPTPRSGFTDFPLVAQSDSPGPTGGPSSEPTSVPPSPSPSAHRTPPATASPTTNPTQRNVVLDQACGPPDAYGTTSNGTLAQCRYFPRRHDYVWRAVT